MAPPTLKHIAEPLRGLALPVGKLHPDPANARRHDDRNIESIVASLSRFGQRQPIVVQKEGMIVRAGNARLEAAKRLGWKKIAAIVVDEDSVEATAYAIADNRTAELAEWDDDTLAELLQALPPDALESTGFTSDDLGEILADLEGEKEIVEDEVPEVEDGPTVAQTGDLWHCGRHRVVCGNATANREAGVLITDPPYGIGFDNSWLDGLGRGSKLSASGGIRGDDGSLDLSWASEYDRRCIWGFPYINHGGSGWLVWDKQPGVDSRGIVTPVEMAETTLRTGFDMIRCMWGGFYRAAGEKREPHPTQKPVQVMTRCIALDSSSDLIVDPFLGSGTTLIAAEQLNRTCYGIEIEPKYVDVVLRRYVAFTGESPVRDSDGARFVDMID